MSRSFIIPGEAMVSVRGMVGSQIASLSQLGLSPEAINVNLESFREDVKVNAWGAGYVPADIQTFTGAAHISMSLVNFDNTILEECVRLSMCAPAFGQVGRTGALMGNGLARFAAGNFFIGLNISSPVAGLPYRFWYAYLDNQVVLPYGTQRQIVTCNWRAIPYAGDPWGGSAAQPNTAAGTGSLGAVVWDRNSDA